ncbi:uncharacterized protein BX664DRAFT_324269, partial [Halteromyces radiatus]|uniref:uncharacterized protein n=1 Tax=Halteromyces radiatus TaxID=101107 RepID=UPI0022204DDD
MRSYIYNLDVWSERWRPIEFITIQRHYPTRPNSTNFRAPLVVRNDKVLQTRSFINRLEQSGGPYRRRMQTFQAIAMKYIGPIPLSGVVTFGFRYFEHLLETMSLTAQEVWYYQHECHVPIPNLALAYESDSTSSTNKRRKTNQSQQQPLRRHDENRHSTQTSTYQEKIGLQQERNARRRDDPDQQSQQLHSQRLPNTDLGGHIFIDVYGLTELMMNKKWMV